MEAHGDVAAAGEMREARLRLGQLCAGAGQVGGGRAGAGELRDGDALQRQRGAGLVGDERVHRAAQPGVLKDAEVIHVDVTTGNAEFSQLRDERLDARAVGRRCDRQRLPPGGWVGEEVGRIRCGCGIAHACAAF
jgi:hypothetical protein